MFVYFDTQRIVFRFLGYTLKSLTQGGNHEQFNCLEQNLAHHLPVSPESCRSIRRKNQAVPFYKYGAFSGCTYHM